MGVVSNTIVQQHCPTALSAGAVLEVMTPAWVRKTVLHMLNQLIYLYQGLVHSMRTGGSTCVCCPSLHQHCLNSATHAKAMAHLIATTQARQLWALSLQIALEGLLGVSSPELHHSELCHAGCCC